MVFFLGIHFITVVIEGWPTWIKVEMATIAPGGAISLKSPERFRAAF
jgi:hypothetical protein